MTASATPSTPPARAASTTASPVSSQPPSWGQIGLYSLPESGMSFMDNLIAMFLLKFTSDVLLLAPGLVALFFGLARIWDAVSDPIVGYWSDRTKTRLGRRRPWILASSLPLALTFTALWAPPAGLSEGALQAWVCAAVILFFTAQTAFAVPHLAWGAEFGGSAHDKTRVFAGRLAVGLAGVFAAAFGMSLLERAADPRGVALLLALVAGGAMVLLCVVATSRLGERPDFQGRGGETPYAAFGDVIRNRHARLMIGVLFLEALGFASMTTTMPFFIQYVSERPGEAGLFMGGALVAMLWTIPLWLALARRFGKKNVWLFSLLGRGVVFGATVLLPADAIIPMVINVAIIGAFFGCGAMLGPSIKADVIDRDAARTGQRKEGSYFATWNLASKGAMGAAVIVSGAVLQGVGFEPNAAQPPLALMGIRAIFGGLPCLFYLLAAALLTRLTLYSEDSGDWNADENPERQGPR